MTHKKTPRLRTELLEDRVTPALVYALDASGTNLLRFDSAAPTTILGSVPISGLAVPGTETLVAIDFRPADGQLYALGINNTLGDDEGRIYALDVTTGKATQAGTAPFSTTLADGAIYGFDLNPVADLFRVVNSADQNLRVSPTTGTLAATDTDLAFGVGDVNTGDPSVVGLAYTNSFPGAGTTTVYAIDFARDRLLTLGGLNGAPSPNGGQLFNVGGLGIDTDTVVGFDITADGVAFASLTGPGATGSQLVRIELSNGVATPIGDIGDEGTGTIRGIAVASAGTLSFSAADYSGTEGKTAVVTVNRGGGTEGTVTVLVSVSGGSASPLSDFTGVPVTLTFGPGEASQDILVTLVDDGAIEGSETINLLLQNPTNGAVIQGQSKATVTILDNDVPDTGPPTVTINQAVGQADPTNVSPIAFTVTFSEPVTGFDGDDVLLGGSAGATTATVTGNGANYTVSVSGMTQTGVVTAIIPAGVVVDAAGNKNLASTSTDNTVAFDNGAPAVVIARGAGQGDVTNVSPIVFVVSFSEPVLGFDASDLVLSGSGSVGTLVAVTGSGSTFTVSVSGFTQAGPVRIDVPEGVATDPAGNPNTAGSGADSIVTFTFNNPTGLDPAISQIFATGADTGGTKTVRVFNPDGVERFNFVPFPNVTGGLRVAAADFTGDSIADVVVGTGPGSPSQVRLIDGKSQAELFSLQPFEAAFLGGVFVTTGDVTGDGRADLIITPDRGGGPRVRIFNGVTFVQIADFFGIEDPNFHGGARAAVGDVNEDGVGDLVVAAGFGGGPRIAVFDGISVRSGTAEPDKLFGDFFVFENTLRNGVFIGAGDLDGDGAADIVAGGGPGGGPRIFALSGRDLLAGTQTQLANFFAGDVEDRGGIRLTIKNLDGDDRADLVTGAGTGSGSLVTGFLGKDILPDGDPASTFAFDAYPFFNGGVFVG